MLTTDEAQRLRRWTYRIATLSALALLASNLPMRGLDIPDGIYLPLHTVLEFLAAAVALLVFATVWHTPVKEVSGALIWIATALMAAGWLDLAHALSFKGMPDFVTHASTQKGIEFWLVARCVLAGTLLALSFHANLPAPTPRQRRRIVAGYAVLNLCVFVAVLAFESQLPATFVEGVGVTPLKSAIEWAVTAALVLATVGYYRQARQTGAAFPTYIAAASAVAALSETFFTAYTVPSDLQNLLGHIYKVLSYWLIYQAMFVVSIRKPYARLAEQAALLSKANDIQRTQSLALNSITNPVVVTDLNGDVTWMNHTAQTKSSSRFGWPQRALNLFSGHVNPDPTVIAQMQAALQQGQSWRSEVHLTDLEGKVMVVDRTVAPIRNEHGATEGYLVVSEDVTERIKARSRHTRVLDTALDGFWITDMQGRLLEVNRAYAHMSGYSVQELLGMHIADLEGTEAASEVQQHIRTVIDTGYDSFETRHRHKAGHDIAVEISVTYDQEQQQLFVFIRDISERVRTAALQHDLEMQLQQAQKMEAIGQLTGGIAHDFNNILASVLGYSRLALDRLVPDKQSKLAQYLGEIIQSSERARDLIQKMLTFTRTKPSAHTVAVRPAAVVHEVLAILRPSMPAGIEVTLDLDENLQVLLDPGDLHQILLNLLINARDAVDAQQGRIQIGLRRAQVQHKKSAIKHEALSGSFVSLEVRDNGSGIASEHMPRLFDPFFTTKDVGKGTGLGLSMVQGLLLRSGGQVVVESTPGQGSLFQLLFQEHTAQTDTAHTPPSQATPGGQTGHAIWVVDDEPSVLSYLCELLEGEGYEVTAFSTPSEALRNLARQRTAPDLLITDLTMPVMGGVELARQLRTHFPGLCVFACSGHHHTAQDNAHIQQWFPKPVPADALLRAMAEVLTR